MDAPAAPPPAAGPALASRRLTVALGVATLLALAAYAAWAWLDRHVVTTEDAYVHGHLVQLTPQVGGTVLAVGADDTDAVRAGQALVRLDPADAKVALLQAQAQLAQSVREVRTLFANNQTLAAQVALRDAEVARARTELERVQENVDRRAGLVGDGAVSREEFEHAGAGLRSAGAALLAAQSAARAAREQLATNQSHTDHTTVASHPSVQRAAARLREAWLAWKRCELPAPVDGQVARRSVQVGQRVQPGAPLLTIVALDALWVEANFKESQLRGMRVGQRATLEADLYGSRVEYRGTVAGLGAGTGAAFALLPPQNATGNWVKVVQRVPVRIELDPAELAADPLRVGLSMRVRVDTSDSSGAPLAQSPRHLKTASTQVFDLDEREVDADVDRIIADNGGSEAQLHAAGTRRSR